MSQRETGGGRWIRTTEGVSQQIYSLPPLAAWVSLLTTPFRCRRSVAVCGGEPLILLMGRGAVNAFFHFFHTLSQTH
ncbi:conserved protein of unknown function [Stenotrophomonas maltophilia]|nr:conserved protein of unknown function [Stenotrophomonas maltophilia]